MADPFETEFSALSNAAVPAPDAAAKSRALALALSAFDDEQKQSAGTQGSESRWRFTDAIKHLWSFPMNKKYLATSVAAALLSVPAAGIILHYTAERPVYYMADRGGMSFESTIHGGPLPLADYQEAGPTEASQVAAKDAVTQVNRQLAVTQLAIIETMRLSSSQMSGMAREQTAAQVLPSSARARFVSGDVNAFHDVAREPVSTFSADVDTTSYSYARREVLAGRLPDPASVRVEEMVNYFPYNWEGPGSAETPFKANVTVMPTPWNKDTKLLHVGIKGYDVAVAAQAPSNLVFLIDVSGSMESPDKLPLLKSAFRMLLTKLKPEDTVSIVTYAGASGVALEPTKVADSARILSVIDGLHASGSTAGADGLAEAYRLAEQSFVKDGVNRIMLATDGDFNVGPSSDEDLKRLVESKRKSGVFLSVLGFGSDFYNDGLMQALAQNGNGVAAYIDSLAEAQKALVQEASASLFTIAKDVKLQVEFNPEKVSEYRLVGYETRALKQEDFNNDKVDAGEIGSGHTVTAIYEIVPKGSPARSVDDLRYKPDEAKTTGNGSDELAFVKIRYKKPGGDKSHLISEPVTADHEVASDRLSGDVKFSVAVAAYGQKLKREAYVEDYKWADVRTLAEQGRGDDRFGYRAEFLRLVDIASGLPETEGGADALPRVQVLPTLR